MDIQSVVYKRLYEKLWDEILEAEFNNQFPKRITKRYVEGLFHIKNRQGSVVGDRFKGANKRDNRYYYKQYKTLNPNKVIAGEVDESCLLSMLDYLQFKLLDEEKEKCISERRQVEVLLERFVIHEANHLNKKINIGERISESSASKVNETDVKLDELATLIFKSYNGFVKSPYQIQEFSFFLNWMDYVYNRIQSEKSISSGIFQHQLELIKKYFWGTTWEVFERSDNDMVIKRVILFGEEDTETKSTETHFSCTVKLVYGPKKTWHGTFFDYDLPQRRIMITILDIDEDSGRENITSSSFRLEIDKLFPDFCIGHTMYVSENKLDVKFKICALRKCNKSENVNLATFDYPTNSKMIPVRIKSMLLNPDIESKENSPYSDIVSTLDIISYRYGKRNGT